MWSPRQWRLNGVKLAKVGPEKTVAVIGDGPIGLLLLMIARAKSPKRLFMIGADDNRLALAAQLGAEQVIDARSGDTVAATLDVNEGAGVDIVLEAAGNPAAIETAIAVTDPGGHIVLQGLCGCVPQRGFDVDRIVVNDLTLRGALGSPGIWPETISLIESGAIDPGLLVTHTVPMPEFGRALEIVRRREAVKLLVRV